MKTFLGRLLTVLIWVTAIYAPLAFGSKPKEFAQILDIALLAISAVGFLYCALRRDLTGIRLAAVILLALLALIGWIHIINPKYEFVPIALSLRPIEKAVSFLPGTVDRDRSAMVYAHGVAMSVFFLVCMMLCRSRRVRWQFLAAIGASGFLIALIGIFQKITHAPSMLWTDNVYLGSAFFAAYLHHGNAAAFLNLCWPASFACLIRTLKEEKGGRHRLVRAFWANATIFTLIGLFVNSSKAGHLLGLTGIILALVLAGILLRFPEVGFKVKAAIGVILALAFTLVFYYGGWMSLFKWDEHFDGARSWESRIVAWKICLELLPDAGVWGVGPGCFQMVFPYAAGDRLQSYWIHAHQDYLQTLIEWGYLGASLWFAIWIGAYVQASGRSRRNQLDISSRMGLVAITVVAFHALVDFPLQIPSIQWLAIFWLALLWRKPAAPPRPKKTVRPRTTVLEYTIPRTSPVTRRPLSSAERKRENRET